MANDLKRVPHFNNKRAVLDILKNHNASNFEPVLGTHATRRITLVSKLLTES
jgi:hypothetical protein